MYYRLRDGNVLLVAKQVDNIVQEILKNLALCGISSIKLILESDKSSNAETLLYVWLISES